MQRRGRRETFHSARIVMAGWDKGGLPFAKLRQCVFDLIGLYWIQIHSAGRVTVSFSFNRTDAGKMWRVISPSGSGLQVTPMR